MKLTHTQEKSVYKACLLNGVDVNYKKLSLCDLTNYKYSQVRNNRRYQVHCEDKKYEWSQIYDNIDPAIEKFIYIRNKIK